MLAFLSRYNMFACAADRTIFGYSINHCVAKAIDKERKFARRNDFGLIARSGKN